MVNCAFPPSKLGTKQMYLSPIKISLSYIFLSLYALLLVENVENRKCLQLWGKINYNDNDNILYTKKLHLHYSLFIQQSGEFENDIIY